MNFWEALVWGRQPKKITKEQIFECHELAPKRFCFATTHPNSLRKFEEGEANIGALNMPFEESIAKIFEQETGINYFQTKTGKFWAPITKEEDYDKAVKFKEKYESTVFLRDCLDCSVALSVNIDNDDEKTELGDLEYEAKFNDCEDSTNEIIERSADFIKSTPLYKGIKFICAVPSSTPGKQNLPMIIAEGIAKKLKLTCLNNEVAWAKTKEQLKNLSFDEKWPILEETGLKIGKTISDNSIILVDDLYQSGQTIQFVGMKLKEAGAKRVLGFSVVKSRNDSDNQ